MANIILSGRVMRIRQGLDVQDFGSRETIWCGIRSTFIVKDICTRIWLERENGLESCSCTRIYLLESFRPAAIKGDHHKQKTLAEEDRFFFIWQMIFKSDDWYFQICFIFNLILWHSTFGILSLAFDVFCLAFDYLRFLFDSWLSSGFRLIWHLILGGD